MKSAPRDNGVGYISASREGMYSKCRYQFYDQVIVKGHDQYAEGYEDALDDPVYLLFGTAMHKTLELFHKNHCLKKSQLIRLFRSAYIDYGVDNKEYYQLGHELCDIYWHYLKYDAPRRILVGTEIRFRVKLGVDKYGQDVYAQGTIDAVFYLGNGIYEIVDYKTSSWLPSTDEFEANTQIALYDIAFRSPEMSVYWRQGIAPKAVLLTMNYLRFDDGVLRTEITDEVRELNRLYFIDTFTQMNTKRKEFYVCRINTMCPYCDSQDVCPRFQEILQADDDALSELIAEFDDDSFAGNIHAISAYKGMVKILETAIANAQEQCESMIKHSKREIVVDDMKYFLGNSSRRFMLPVMTMNILREHGLWDEKEFMPNVPVGKVERLCKENPEVWDELVARGAVRKSNGAPTMKSKKVQKGLLFEEKRRRH